MCSVLCYKEFSLCFGRLHKSHSSMLNLHSDTRTDMSYMQSWLFCWCNRNLCGLSNKLSNLRRYQLFDLCDTSNLSLTNLRTLLNSSNDSRMHSMQCQQLPPMRYYSRIHLQYDNIFMRHSNFLLRIPNSCWRLLPKLFSLLHPKLYSMRPDYLSNVWFGFFLQLYNYVLW
jgi:hypothetical protein